VQLSPSGVEEEEEVPVPLPAVVGTSQRPVGRFRISPASATPRIIPQQLSFHDELMEKCRERGRTPDQPALFGVRPVTNPSVSKKKFSFAHSLVGSFPIHTIR
jgi:hypothetical protein